MGEVETIHVRGEGGAIWEMDLPLRADVAKRLEAGQLVRVNPDGTAWVAPAAPDPDPSSENEDPDDEDGEDDEDGDTPPELAEFLATPPEPVAPKKAVKKAQPPK